MWKLAVAAESENSLDNKGYMASHGAWAAGCKLNAVAHAAPGDFDRRKPSKKKASTRVFTQQCPKLAPRHCTRSAAVSRSGDSRCCKEMAEAITKSGKVYRTWLTDEELDERAWHWIGKFGPSVSVSTKP